MLPPSISYLGNASFRCWYDEGGQKRRHLQLGFVGVHVQLFRAFMNGLSASVVADSIQGDHSFCAKPLVDIDLKVAV